MEWADNIHNGVGTNQFLTVKRLQCLKTIDQKQNCMTTSEQYYYIDLSGQFVTQFRKLMMPPFNKPKGPLPPQNRHSFLLFW